MTALACVMGGMDVVRPLGSAGIRSAVVARAGMPQTYSRFTVETIDLGDPWARPDELVERLVHFGSRQSDPPVLFYDQDGYVLFVSRHREVLGRVFRFAIADATLVEDLVDKSRFHELAARLGLPVPATRLIRPGAGSSPADVDLAFPIIVKPLTRRDRDVAWAAVGAPGKALRIDSPDELVSRWPRLAAASVALLAQELIPGPESRIESYHVYVDQQGGVVADFTGQELRTYPVEFGHSTSAVTTDAADVRALGRDLVERLGLRGVAKFDFKRAPDGRLHLLEVNPRFSFWSHQGSKAGVNLPALVYGDLVGQPRPAVGMARAGVSWCDPIPDSKAARAAHLSFFAWAAWFVRCDAKAALALDDPWPFVRGTLWRQRLILARKLGRLGRRIVSRRTRTTMSDGRRP